MRPTTIPPEQPPRRARRGGKGPITVSGLPAQAAPEQVLLRVVGNLVRILAAGLIAVLILSDVLRADIGAPHAALFALSCLSGALLTLVACRLAPRFNLVDRPDGHRKLHKRAIPLGGGVAVFLATVLGVALVLATTGLGGLLESSRDTQELLAILAGSAAIVVVGIVDDRYHLRGRDKLLGQVFAACILMAGGMFVRRLAIFGWQLDLGALALPVSLLWMLGTVNAVNLLDGMDGLASGIGVVVCIALATIGAMTGCSIASTVAMALAGSLLGFLFLNYPPAKIFLGDTGSMLIGLVAGALTLRSCQQEPGTLLVAPCLVLWTVPMFDSVIAILRRRLTGRSIYATDRGHLHHRLLHAFGNPRHVLSLVTLCCAAAALAALTGVGRGDDAIAVLASVALTGAMAGTGLFGAAELKLATAWLLDGALSIEHAFVGRGPQCRSRAVRLQGTRHWEVLWERVTESATKLELSAVSLDLNLPFLQESFNAKWMREAQGDPDRHWHMDLPLVVGARAVGRLTVVGHRDGASASRCLHELIDLLEPFEIALESLTQDAVEPEQERRTPREHPVL